VKSPACWCPGSSKVPGRTIAQDLTGVARQALENPEAFKEEVEQQMDQLDDMRKSLKKGGPEKVLEGCWVARVPTRHASC
jgi:hypothetical protein